MLMSQEEIDNILLAEESGDFVGPFKGGERKGAPPMRIQYSVWNPPVSEEVPDEPGIVMRVNQKVGDKWSTTKERVDHVNAVLLFATPARDFTKIRKGSPPETLCHSHDGQHPSTSIDSPLCRKATASDVVQVIGKFKGYDSARIEEVSHELTQGTGQLQMCGLKTANGLISICPFSRKDPLTGAKAACKEQLYVSAYDLDRKRPFFMELTGKSIRSGDTYTAPIHSFFKALRSMGPLKEDGKPKGLPCYAVKVKLSPLRDGRYYILDVLMDSQIDNAEELVNMQTTAHEALERYQKASMRLSKAAYEASRKEKIAAKETVTKEEVKTVIPAEPKGSVSFEDDDIPF